jgi:hypothetical protein
MSRAHRLRVLEIDQDIEVAFGIAPTEAGQWGKASLRRDRNRKMADLQEGHVAEQTIESDLRCLLGSPSCQKSEDTIGYA